MLWVDHTQQVYDWWRVQGHVYGEVTGETVSNLLVNSVVAIIILYHDALIYTVDSNIHPF